MLENNKTEYIIPYVCLLIIIFSLKYQSIIIYI